MAAMANSNARWAGCFAFVLFIAYMVFALLAWRRGFPPCCRPHGWRDAKQIQFRTSLAA